MCKLNSPEANCKVMTSKEEKIKEYNTKNYKNKEIFIIIIIIIIIIKGFLFQKLDTWRSEFLLSVELHNGNFV
jgi:hypothetical protein